MVPAIAPHEFQPHPGRITDHVIATDAGGIRTIRMNRPNKKNVLTLAMYEAMTAALERANASDAVRCVLIASVPGVFSAGNGLADFLNAAQSSGDLIAPHCASCLRSFAAASRWWRR
jgi:enoyl-CoA hydratase/carnithine racemase